MVRKDHMTTRLIDRIKEFNLSAATADEMLEWLSPWMIGLWRYRILTWDKTTGAESVPCHWAVTVCHHGLYWDTQGNKTQEEALRNAIRLVCDLERKYGPCPLAECENSPGKLTPAKMKRLLRMQQPSLSAGKRQGGKGPRSGRTA
jgi:hypothetical protein